jgi:hypothetical protein
MVRTSSLGGFELTESNQRAAGDSWVSNEKREQVVEAVERDDPGNNPGVSEGPTRVDIHR